MTGRENGRAERRAQVANPRPEASPRVRDEHALARFAAVLAGLAALLGVALFSIGEPFPPLGLLALFAVLAWFAVNRYSFFPSEMSVTAESAVLLASVVVFHRDAPLLGPWCVAVLVGPLDALHWEHRAFSRMAYNAAHQVLAVVLAAVVFDSVITRGALSSLAVVAAAAFAAATFCALAVVAGVGVLQVYAGYAPRSALRHLLALDWMILPLGVLGVLAGHAALTSGWWVLPVMLVPTTFVPEFALSCARALLSGSVDAVRRRLAVCGAMGGALFLAAPVDVLFGTDGLLVMLLVALAVAMGAELRAGQPGDVPPLVGLLVALPIAAAGGAWAAVAGSIAAAMAVAVSCATGGVAARRAFLLTIATLLAAAVVGGVTTSVMGHTGWSSPGRALGALASGLVCSGVAAVMVVRRRRRSRAARVLWAVPIFATVVVAGLAVARFGPTVALLPCLGLPALAVLVVLWASPPWDSGLLCELHANARLRHRAFLLSTVAVVGLAIVAAATAADSPGAEAAAVLAALGVLELELVLAAVGTRQWRFHPGRRAQHATLIMLGASGLLLACPTLAKHAPTWSLVVGLGAAAIALATGLRPAWQEDRARSLEPSRNELDRSE